MNCHHHIDQLRFGAFDRHRAVGNSIDEHLALGQFSIQHACDSFVNEIEIVKLMLDAHAKTHNINHKMKRPTTPHTRTA